MWNRQRTDSDLVDPANTGLGHRPVQRWNLPEGWVISARPAHPAIITETDFIAAQDLAARRGPGSPAGRGYLLAGLVRCGTCERLLESRWSNGKPAYRCRHGHTTAPRPDPPGRRTLTSARTRSSLISRPWASCSVPRPAAAGSRTQRTHRSGRGGSGDQLPAG